MLDEREDAARLGLLLLMPPPQRLKSMVFEKGVGDRDSFRARHILWREKGRCSKTMALTVVGMNSEVLAVIGKETSVMRPRISDGLALM